MKFNVIFIKIKSLIFIFCLSIVILFSFLLSNKLYQNNLTSIPTATKPQAEEYLKCDLNGDNKDDLIYISSKDNIYYMEAHINNKTYFFNTKNPNTLGTYNISYPLSVKLIDLNNDNIPEIITESSLNSASITHIFMLHNNEFKEIFCSTNNFLGILNSSNYASPILISSSLNTPSENLNTYILDNNMLKNISMNNLSLQSLNIINNIISFIESSENTYDNISNLFSNNISSLEISLLQNLKTDGYSYLLENCFLESTSSYSSLYTLTFKKYHEYENNKFILNIGIDKINDTLLITSIK